MINNLWNGKRRPIESLTRMNIIKNEYKNDYGRSKSKSLYQTVTIAYYYTAKGEKKFLFIFCLHII